MDLRQLPGRTLTTSPPSGDPAASPHGRWALLYDADCGFCMWIVSGVLAWDRHDRLAPCAIQSAPGQALLSDLSPGERLASVHLVSPAGERLSAGAAAAPLLRLLPGGAIPARLIARAPRLTGRAYDWVAAHRSQISRAVPAGAKRRASARVGHLEAARAYHIHQVHRMRLPSSAHTSRPWRIHELTPDFRLEDVWALPTPGGPGDFPRLVAAFAAGDPARGSSRAARALWAIRWKAGELLGLDDPDAGSHVPTLRDRLPADLRDGPSGPEFDALPFSPLYLLDDEWAAEIANRTVHGVMHLAWVADGTGGHRGQMAVLVKPNGLLGSAYMAAIKPFRHRIVYPPAMRQIGRDWVRRGGPGPGAGDG